MTTENVDIQVQGTVKPQIETNIRGIAKAANEGYSAIERLQKMLNQLDSGGLSGIQSSMNGATAQIEKQTRALQDAAASSRMQASNLRVLQQQIDRTNASQQAASATTAQANDRLLEMARNAVNAAQAERDKTVAHFEAARAITAESTATQQNIRYTQEQIQAAQAATRAARDQIAATNAQAAAEDQLQSTQQRSTIGWRDYSTGLQKTGDNAQLARHHLLNLGFQLQDIGVSLASGQNPLTVAVQQGAQIQGIASQAGVGLGRMAVAAAALVAPMIPLAAVLGLVAGGIKIMSDELTKGSGLEKFSKDLGLSQKQIKTMNGDVVTMTDVFKAFFTTIGEVTGLSEKSKSFFDKLKSQYKDFANTTVREFNMIGAASDAAAFAFLTAWQKLPVSFQNIFVKLYNSGVNIITELVNFTIRGVNQITAAANKLGNIKIPQMEEITFSKMEPAKEQENGRTIAEAWAIGYENSMKTRTKAFDTFYKKWQENSVKGAKDRITKAFEDSGGNSKQEESRAAALAKVNLQLDNQISRLQQLKPVREQQQQYDQIEEQLLGKKIALNAAEAASIKSKIAAIQEQKQVTQEMDRIYEEIQGSSDQYAAQLAAIDALLKQGFLSQDQYAAKMASATEAYEQSIDPLRKYRQEIAFQESTIGKTSEQIEMMTLRHQIEQEALKNGTALRQADVDALIAQATALQYAQGVQQQYIQIYGETAGALQTVEQRTQALQMAYANGLIGVSAFNAGLVQSQIEAARLRVAMDNALPGDAFTASLGQLMQGYQGMIAGVSNSLGDMFNTLADGFSNAIAGAIMGTESLGDAISNVAQQAVQQLIASLIKLGIQYAINAAIGQSLGAAGVAASIAMGSATAVAWAPAAAAVSLATLGANAGPATAGILSTNAVSMGTALAGFQQGGYTGNGAADKVAGLVHAGEYVMTADTVSRLGLGVMDAIQAGRPVTGSATASFGLQSAGNVGTGSVTVNVINNANGTTATTTEEDNGQGGKDITITIDSLENAMASRVRSGQGPLSSAMQDSYGIQHQTVLR